MTGHLRAVVAGESVVDILVHPDGQEDWRAGGSPLNVAVGLARLGADVTLITQVGKDRAGDLVTRHLRESHVDTVFVGPAGRTSRARAIRDERGGASYDFDLTWDPASLPRVDAPVDVVHVGSIATVIAPGAATVRAWVETVRPDCFVSYDPNVRPSLTGRGADVVHAVERMLNLADLVKVSSEDLTALYGGVDHDELAQRWLDGGPSVVVVTYGSDGSVAYTRETSTRVAATAVDVVDTIGAGDSFMSGLLWSLGTAGHLCRTPNNPPDPPVLRQALTFATACAASTVTRPGADPPYLHSVE